MQYWWIIIIILILFLIWSERGSQDCARRPGPNGKACINATDPVSSTDDSRSAIDKTIETVRKNHTLVGWRRALFIALIVTIPICLALNTKRPLRERFPSGHQFFVVASIIFVVAYFSSVWLNAVWFAPQDNQIENSLLHLRRQY